MTPALTRPASSRFPLAPVLIMAAVVLLDQITKVWAVAALSDGQSVEVLGRFFMLTLVYNQGGALGTSFGSSTYYLIASILILLFVFYYIYSHRHLPHIAWPLSFIAGGALGNIIDRVRLGQVVDFIDIDFFNIPAIGLDRWWTFNLADAAISCSIVYLLVTVVFGGKKRGAEGGAAIDGTPE